MPQWSTSQIHQWLRTSHSKPTSLCSLRLIWSSFSPFPRLSWVFVSTSWPLETLQWVWHYCHWGYPPSGLFSDTTKTIYMISSSSSSSISLVIEDSCDQFTHCFHNDEEILEAISTHEYPWDDMHHLSFFLHDEPLSSLDQYSFESKDFIHGKG